MKPLRLLAAAAALLALSACATSPPAPAGSKPGSLSRAQKPDEVPRPPVDTIDVTDACGAAGLQRFVGQPVKAPGVPLEGPSVRHIYPDTIVTMDFRANRLNIEMEKDGKIVKIRCG